jgi:hemerythrin superfamily protein
MQNRDVHEEQTDLQDAQEQQGGGLPDLPAMIKADHELVEGLFIQFEQAGGNANRQAEVARQVYQALESHTQLEEQLVYPAARAEVYEQGDPTVDGFLQAHQKVTELLNRLQNLSPLDSAFAPCFQGLMDSVREHVEEEETTLFPDLYSLPEAQLEELAEEWEQGKLQHGVPAQ